MTYKVENIIWMIWKDDEGKSFKIGELSKNTEKYYFKYDMDGVEKAKEYGFTPLPYFPKIDAKYFREGLFSSFLQRLPGHSKKDKSSILKQYGIEKYDDFELLKRIGNTTSTDNIEFISPYDEEKTVLDEENIVMGEK